MADNALMRCPAGVKGRYTVSLRVANHKAGDDEIRVQIGSHQPVFRHGSDGLAVKDDKGVPVVLDQAPSVSTSKPFEGDLCEHEVQFLEGMPGKDYRMDYEFTVEKVKDAD